MRYIKMYLVLCLIALTFVFNSNDAKAEYECPEGFIQQTFTITIENCEWEYDIC